MGEVNSVNVYSLETLIFEAFYDDTKLTLKFAGIEEVFDLTNWTFYTGPVVIEDWGNKFIIRVKNENPIYAEVLVCNGYFRFCVYRDYAKEQRISIVTTWKKINDFS